MMIRAADFSLDLYTFLSFVSDDTGKNIGCCIVKAPVMKAFPVTVMKGINPGGEVLMFGLDRQEFEHQDMELDRLYSKSEMKELGFKTKD